MRKFKLTGESKAFSGKTLYRIEASISFGSVIKGDRGGYVETEDNLSHEGDAWVSDNAWVYGDARVSDNARVYGDAKVYDNAWVSDNAWVYDNARVYGDAKVYGDARVYGNAKVSDDAKVYGDARVSGDAKVNKFQVINIIGLDWSITISDYHLQIGCEMHKFEEWEAFTDKEIDAMNINAPTFRKAFKDIILSIIQTTRRRIS